MSFPCLTFLKEFLTRPAELGTIVPSSSFLESRLQRLAGLSDARVVVELGPGTGGTTSAILSVLPREAALLAVEINPRFVSRLRARRDSRLMVHLGSAENLTAAMRSFELPAPDVVISGIPFSSLPRFTARRILRSIWNGLAPSGRFVAYQFRREIEKLGRGILGRPQMEFELLNVPPLHVYRWQKPGTLGPNAGGLGSLASETGTNSTDAIAHGMANDFHYDCHSSGW